MTVSGAPRQLSFGTLGAGFTAVLLWSTTASVAGYLAKDMQYAGIAFYPVCAAVVVMLPLLGKSGFWKELQVLSGSQIWTLVIASFALAGYELALYYSLTHSPKIEAYVITYTWPLLFMALRIIIARLPWRQIPYSDVVYMALAFCGAMLLIFNNGRYQGLHSIAVYWSSIAGAVGIALYMTLVAQLQGIFSTRIYPFFLTALFSLPLTLIFCFTTKASLSWNLRVPSIILVLYEGIFVFLLGYIAWLFAIARHPNVTLASLIYLVPLISVVLLNALLGEPLTQIVLYSTILIVLANLALHSEYHNTSATTASMAFALLLGLVCYLTPARNSKEAAGMIDVTGAIFAILIGFTLNRVATKSQLEKQVLATASARASRLKRAIRCQYPSDVSAQISECLDTLFRRLVDFHICEIDSIENEEAVDAIFASESRIIAEIDKLKIVYTSEPQIASEMVSDLIEIVDQWLLLRSERLRTGEFVTVVMLGLLTVSMFVVGRHDSLVGDISAICLSTGIAFVLFAIRDYDENRLDRSIGRLSVLEHFFRLEGHDYYVPRTLLSRGIITSSTKIQRVRYEDENGEIRIAELPKRKPFESMLLSLAFTVAFVWVLYLLALRRHG